ncbi:alpha/beta fold hydrolase [Paenibacillus sp. CGMCC 1.16610]|uniref:Alpha/beta fold hydrolase n=2 Tax=Paenibacillus TaxID=44249 RepID=A0ABU6DIZ2_9BACL|nr:MULTISPECIES: alpha/beta fold hydrolase [Paenibacillus]MBA2942693.1 alpha/beta fold hydrolase [Paenibacillus sp. CGMCC 1.16610]MCY9659558.1 alpha/beta hydrolase [Paenibacillus anseongense]MEB4796953.1 alpha/beta fold hydrolase [Paenibacillus chondroitinus]MVQ38179.1 alpha/beta fold hydrolase [Paenibacillus anseongense]
MSSTSLSPGSIQPTLEQVVTRPLLRKKRLVLTILISFLTLCTSLLLAFHAYIAWTLARPHIDPLHSDPMRAVGLPYSSITFPSLNGTSNLDGWFIPAPSNKTVIFSHGYGGNREELWVPLYNLARELHLQNYNVLMFDYGYVQPGNERIMTGGIQESQELLGAINYVKHLSNGPIYIWGFSMGAGTALQAALQNGKDISGMILDSTFMLNPDTLYHNMKQVVNVPKFPSLPLVRLFFPLLNGVSLHEVPYKKVTSTAYSMPIYFIHGTEDSKAPYEMVEDIFKVQDNAQSKLWIIPKAQHELLYRAEPKKYVRTSLSFLNGLTPKETVAAVN